MSDSFKANRNDSLFLNYTKIFLDYKNSSNRLWSVVRCGSGMTSDLEPKAHRSIVQRAAVTYLFRAFSLFCWTNTIMYKPSIANRMIKCPPIGFSNNGFHPCKHILCPNCHMRKAAAYSKSLMNLDQQNPAIVLKVETPFDEHMHGYVPAILPNTPRIRALRRCMGLDAKSNLYVTSGVALTDRRPSITVNFHVIPDPQDIDRKMESAQDFADKIVELEEAFSTKVKIVKVEKTAYLTSNMYEDCPVKLIGTSDIGFKDLRLQYTVNEYCDALYNKRINKSL